MCKVDVNETKAIINAMELRMNRRIDNLHRNFEDKLFRSYNGVSEIISNSMEAHTKELKNMNETNKTEHKQIFDKLEEVQPIINLRNGVISVKSVLLGASAVILALGVIGSGFIWLVKQAIHLMH